MRKKVSKTKQRRMMEEVLLSRTLSPKEITRQERKLLGLPETFSRVKFILRTREFRARLTDDQIMRYLESISTRVPAVKFSIMAITEQTLLDS